MKKKIIVLLLPAFLFFQCDRTAGPGNRELTFEKIEVTYPETKRDTTVVDDYHGKLVADPYRWLEDDHSPETGSWVKAQNDVTFSYLDQIPYREAIEKRLSEVWNYERYSSPFREGGKYYFFKNDGLQNQSVLYELETLEGEPKMVLDPNTFSEDGTASMGTFDFSKNGRYLAYQISEGGSDWRAITVKDLDKDRALEDTVRWVKFSGIAWAGEGFYYCRYPAPAEGDELSQANEFHQVYYHKLGDTQKMDRLIFADRRNPNHGFSVNTTEDERFLVLGVWASTSGNALFFKDLKSESSEFVTITESFDDDYTLIDNVGDNLLFLTNNNAPNQRLISVPASKPDEGFWEDLIPESDDVLRSVRLCGDKIVAHFIHNASSQIKSFSQTGTLEGKIELPGLGTVSNLQGEKGSPEVFYSFASFSRPSTVYKLNLTNLESTVYKKPAIKFDSDQYETSQVWYEGYDGTKIPMSITRKKGLALDGQHPTLLYGYGGFDISILPRFDIKTTVLLENDGIYAVANIRGGGEFGKKWHQAGTKDQKQNVFNDFQAAAEYLIENKYTSNDKLAIEGRSNGGLLVGACMTQRPDLYKVAFPGVGVLDMLRYHKFTIGAAWATDYGRSDNEKDFDFLIAYSPLHNLEPANYPATLVTTADHDDRVVPAHSFKFISELQGNQKGDNPVLIRIETSAGHGAGKPTSKRIEESADMLAFMFYNMKENVVYEYEVED